MPLKVVRNDIVRMECDAIVNTANEKETFSTGVDYAVYQAAGWEELLEYRKNHIGEVAEGGAFITPSFQLKNVRYIIHAVSPCYIDGKHGEEAKLRSCYRKSLQIALEHELKSIAFPLISAGGFGYPHKEAIHIAQDEITGFLMEHEMTVYLVLFGDTTISVASMLYPDIHSYIDSRYVRARQEEEYFAAAAPTERREKAMGRKRLLNSMLPLSDITKGRKKSAPVPEELPKPEAFRSSMASPEGELDEKHETAIGKRMLHLQDTFSEYLLYLIESKGMTNAEVYNNAAVSKRAFSKIKNNPDAHPSKTTALCLCIGLKLNRDEAVDLLARAGYALSPSSKTDIIFSYFIENHIYNIYDLDILLGEYGEPQLIT